MMMMQCDFLSSSFGTDFFNIGFSSSPISLGKDAKDFYELNSVIIRELIHRFNDENMSVVKAANKAFAALSKCVPAEELVNDIEYMRNLLASLVSDARRRKGGVGDGEFLLPGFNIPKGESVLFLIFLLCRTK